MDKDCWYLSFLVIICLAFGIALGANIERGGWKAICIKRGIANYNETTGDWQWKSDVVEMKDKK